MKMKGGGSSFGGHRLILSTAFHFIGFLSPSFTRYVVVVVPVKLPGITLRVISSRKSWGFPTATPPNAWGAPYQERERFLYLERDRSLEEGGPFFLPFEEGAVNQQRVSIPPSFACGVGSFKPPTPPSLRGAPYQERERYLYLGRDMSLKEGGSSFDGRWVILSTYFISFLPPSFALLLTDSLQWWGCGS